MKYSKIYIGYTSDLIQRIKSHNELGQKGWTIKFRPWILVYSEQFADKTKALLKEKELKAARGREWIWSLINNKIKKGLISAQGGREFDPPLRNKGDQVSPFFIHCRRKPQQ